MVKVILVRHGETDWNRARRIQGGNSDTQLNQNGRQGAESLALRLKPEKIQAIYTSPLQRARETAQAIAQYHQLEVKIEPTLKEIEVGEHGLLITQDFARGLLLPKVASEQGWDRERFLEQ